MNGLVLWILPPWTRWNFRYHCSAGPEKYSELVLDIQSGSPADPLSASFLIKPRCNSDASMGSMAELILSIASNGETSPDYPNQ